MARIAALRTPFFEPKWRRVLIVTVGLLLGLILFFFGLAYTGTVLCAASFWLGYELLVVYNVDTGRREK